MPEQISPGKTKRHLNVFEAGCGKVPVGMIQQAVKAERRGLRQRSFTGADIEGFNLDKVLKKLGVSNKPANLRVMQACAIDTLRKLEPESQHVIFGSYFLNHIALHGKSNNMLLNAGEFVSAAKRALVPGGRIVLVLDNMTSLLAEDLATRYEMFFYKRVLSDKEAKKSPAKFIRRRATPQKRAELIRRWIQRGELTPVQVARSMGEQHLSMGELVKPAIYILRKPRKGENKIRAVTRLNVDLIEDPAIRKAAKEILG